jgi:hypothetical protein
MGGGGEKGGGKGGSNEKHGGGGSGGGGVWKTSDGSSFFVLPSGVFGSKPSAVAFALWLPASASIDRGLSPDVANAFCLAADALYNCMTPDNACNKT